MQLYLKHIKNNLSEMTYAELVQLETEQFMKHIAEST